MELLSREMGDNVWLSNIRYENQRMSGLISQLLELAKTENVAPPEELLNFSRLVLGEDAVANTVTLTGKGQWEEGA